MAEPVAFGGVADEAGQHLLRVAVADQRLGVRELPALHGVPVAGVPSVVS